MTCYGSHMTQFDPFSTAMGHSVRVAIVKAGETQTTIADKLGLSLRSLTRRITGQFDFSAGEVYRLSQILAIEVDDLYADAVAILNRRNAS